MSKQDIIVHIAVRKDNWFNRYFNIFGNWKRTFTTKLTINESEELLMELIEKGFVIRGETEK